MANSAANVIAAVCENKDIFVVMGERPELFGAYGDTYDFIREYYMQHKEVPTKEVVEQRFPDVELPSVSGATAYHLNTLKSEFVNSRIDQIMLKAGSAEARNMMTAEERLGKLTSSLAGLGQYVTMARDLDITDVDLATEHFEKVRAISEENGGSPGISTGFDTIDSAYTTGLAGGHYIVAIGYSGKGKSMFTGLLGVNAWKQGKKVMVVSLEMGPEEYRSRVYAEMGAGQFRISDLERGDVDLDDFRTWGGRNLENSSQFIVTSNEGVTNVTPNVIQAKVDMHKPDLVILDYLQLMSDNAGTGDMTRRMLNLSRELKLLATANNIPVIAISAVTDEDNDKRDAPPLISQISWSKGIEYDANHVIAIHRHTDTNLVEVVCRKNRHGDLYAMYFNVDFDRGIWEEKFDI